MQRFLISSMAILGLAIILTVAVFVFIQYLMVEPSTAVSELPQSLEAESANTHVPVE